LEDQAMSIYLEATCREERRMGFAAVKFGIPQGVIRINLPRQQPLSEVAMLLTPSLLLKSTLASHALQHRII
jgi:hypothetical protein